MINLEKKTREIGSINFVAFSNNVVVVNTTPHPVTMQDMDGTLITVPTSMLINAKAEERKVSDLFVRTEFVGTEEGKEILETAVSLWQQAQQEFERQMGKERAQLLLQLLEEIISL